MCEAKGSSKMPSFLSLLLISVVVSSLSSETAAQDTMCKKPTGQESNGCACETESGGIIDLSGLDRTDGKPR